MFGLKVFLRTLGNRLKLHCDQCDVDLTIDVKSDQTPSCGRCGQPLHSSPEFLDSIGERNLEGEADTETRTLDHPSRIGTYRVVSHVATGGFGTVYKAYDNVLDRYLAIKTPKRQLSESARQEFIEEAQTIAKLDHPGIVPVYEAGSDENGNAYIAMKWVDGQTLAQYSRAQSVGYRQAATLVSQISEALHFAHKKGFVHRDLKPSNILMSDDGRPFVADFGLSIHEDKQHEFENQVAGTCAYMSPEQIRGEAHFLDGRSDIWSLGVVFYELLCNRRPFKGKTHIEFKHEILERDPKPIRQISDNIPSEIARICDRCLCKGVSGRYQSALDVSNDISAALNSIDSKPTRPRLALFSIVGVALLLVAMVGGLFLAPQLQEFFTDPNARSEQGDEEDGEITSTRDKVESNKPVPSNPWVKHFGEDDPRIHVLWPVETTIDEDKNGRRVLTPPDLGFAYYPIQFADSNLERLELTVSQKYWKGNFGVFVGQDGNKLRRIDFHYDSRNKKAHVFEIVVFDVILPNKSGGPSTEISIDELPDVVQFDSGLKELKIALRFDQLGLANSITVCDKPLPNVTKSISKQNISGHCGVFAFHGEMRFKSLSKNWKNSND